MTSDEKNSGKKLSPLETKYVSLGENRISIPYAYSPQLRQHSLNMLNRARHQHPRYVAGPGSQQLLTPLMF